MDRTKDIESATAKLLDGDPEWARGIGHYSAADGFKAVHEVIAAAFKVIRDRQD